MKKAAKIIIVIFSVLIISGGSILGTLYFTGFFTRNRNFSRQNFQLNESQIKDINSFFNSNPSSNEIQTYCTNNRGYCFYYCRQNPTSSSCSQLNFPSQTGTQAQTG